MPKYLVTAIPTQPIHFVVIAATVEAATKLAERGDITGGECEVKAVEDLSEVFPEHSPHVKFEYDYIYTGGDYRDIGDYAYVPAALIDLLGAEEAFEAATGINKVHIIHYNNDDVDELYTADGDAWIEAGELWAEEQAEALVISQSLSIYIAIIDNEGHFDLELETSLGDIASTYDTGTDDVDLARSLADRVEARLTSKKITVYTKRDKWEAHLTAE